MAAPPPPLPSAQTRKISYKERQEQERLHALTVRETRWEDEYPLHAAAQCGGLREVIRLLALKKNPNEQDDDGWTPSHYAIYYHRDCILTLLLKGAAGCGALQCIFVLLRFGADPAAIDGDGATPSQLAMRLQPLNHQNLVVLLAIARHLRPDPHLGAYSSDCRLVPRHPLRLATS